MTAKPDDAVEGWTKGAWTWDAEGLVQDEDGHGIAQIHGRSRINKGSEERANADLICAAPDLYAALASVYPEVRDSHDAGDGHFSTEQVRAAEAALKLARGEQ